MTYVHKYSAIIVLNVYSFQRYSRGVGWGQRMNQKPCPLREAMSHAHTLFTYKIEVICALRKVRWDARCYEVQKTSL